LGLAGEQPFARLATGGENAVEALTHALASLAVRIAAQIVLVLRACLSNVAGFLVGNTQQLLGLGAALVCRSGENLAQELDGLRVVALLESGPRLVLRRANRAEVGSRQRAGGTFFWPGRRRW